jgi:hypothetical protein
MNAAIVIGGYGTFGAHVARELCRLGVPLVIAGRDRARAEAFARSLSSECGACTIDVTRPDSCAAALKGNKLAVNCAGPFGELGTSILDACLAAGCHYVDIADDRRYTALVREYGERFQRQNLAVVPGCSSLPGISGALGLLARRGGAPPERARVTLFIGNNNPKGDAAVRSLLAGLGQPIAAPQGTIHGFRDREVVLLPAPFGARGVFNFESPEYDLFPALLGVRSISVKVGFELRLANAAFALLAWLGWNCGPRTARMIGLPAGLFRWIGTSGGAVMTELFYVDGTTRRAALVARRDGQRMASLPCALVAHALHASASVLRGAGAAYEVLGAAGLVDRLVAEGFELHIGE